MADTNELPNDHPMRVAFREYQNTDEYKNNRKWAQFSQNVDGSLWSVFIAGMSAQSKLNVATPPADAALADDLPMADYADVDLERIIEKSDGHWREDVFCVDGPSLMKMLNEAASLCHRPPHALDAALIGKLRHQLAQVTEECAALRARPQAVAEGFERVAWQRVSDDGKPLPIFVTLREHLSPACKYRDVLAAGKSGFVVVPVEPTPEMVMAFMKEFYKKEKSFDTAACYRAMLAASQSATGGAK